MKGFEEERVRIKGNGNYLFDKTEQEHLKKRDSDLHAEREVGIEVTPSGDNTEVDTVHYPRIHATDESDDVFMETRSRRCKESIALANGLCTDKEFNLIEIDNTINNAIANIQAGTAEILRDIVLNKFLDESRISSNDNCDVAYKQADTVDIIHDIMLNNSFDESISSNDNCDVAYKQADTADILPDIMVNNSFDEYISSNDNCDVACAKQAKMARDSLAHIWEDTSYDESSNCAISVHDNIENELVLRIVLTKSAQCERKIIQKQLGTPETLFVQLERSDLVELKKGVNNQHKSKRKQYLCQVCPFETSTKFKLLVHADEHKELTVLKNHVPARYIRPGDTPNKVLYKCPDCTYCGDDKWKFNRHLNVHKSKPYRCANCSFKTRNEHCLVKHMKFHKSRDEADVHKCPYCNFATYGKTYIAQHIKMLHETRSVELLSCNVCGFKTKYEKSLKDHMLIHVPSQRKRYKCPLCSFETSHKSYLRTRHMLTHGSDEETRIFCCAHCDYKANTKAHLKVHLMYHNNPEDCKMHNCKGCTYQSLVHKADEVTSYKCSICNYVDKSSEVEGALQHRTQGSLRDEVVYQRPMRVEVQSPQQPQEAPAVPLGSCRCEDVPLSALPVFG